MKFSTVVLVALSTALIDASCYTGGQTTKSENVKDFLPTICQGLSGKYVTNEQRQQCVTDTAGVKWNFNLKYIGGGESRSILSTECQNGYGKEIMCGHGGNTAYTNWEYTADPNAGSCYGIVKS